MRLRIDHEVSFGNGALVILGEKILESREKESEILFLLQIPWEKDLSDWMCIEMETEFGKNSSQSFMEFETLRREEFGTDVVQLIFSRIVKAPVKNPEALLRSTKRQLQRTLRRASKKMADDLVKHCGQ